MMSETLTDKNGLVFQIESLKNGFIDYIWFDFRHIMIERF
jgi:hypothetical protein